MENMENREVAVSNLQRYLRQLAYHNKEIPLPPVDGIFDTKTEESLMAFQREEGLPVTGVADEETWNALYAAYLSSVEGAALPERVSIFPSYPPGFVLSSGEDGFPVLVLQYMLRELRVNYGITLPVELTGTFDDVTFRAVSGFQERNFLPATGIVNKSTWNCIVGQFNLLEK